MEKKIIFMFHCAVMLFAVTINLGYFLVFKEYKVNLSIISVVGGVIVTNLILEYIIKTKNK